MYLSMHAYVVLCSHAAKSCPSLASKGIERMTHTAFIRGHQLVDNLQVQLS
jgi:hypothetical protein